MSEAGYLVFETGGTKLVAGVADPDCRIRDTRILFRDRSDRAAKSFTRLLEAGQELRKVHEQKGISFRAVGFGFGGYVRRSTREPLGCLHEAGWEDLDVPGSLQREFGLPITVENDCKLAALAEAHFGAGQGQRTVFYMTVGTGVGGGIVRDGKIQVMSDVGEAEIGHIVVAPEGPACWCGGRGCVESVCSGPGMSQLAGLLAEQDGEAWKRSRLAAAAASAAVTPSEAIIEAWRSGDAFARSVVERAAGYLATASAAAINLLSPDVFVIGGGVMWGNSDLLELVAEKVRNLVVVYFRDRYQVVPSALREQVVTQGAAILAAQESGRWSAVAAE